MRIYILVNLLFVLVMNVSFGSSLPSFRIFRKLKTLFSDADLELFNRGDGLWFLNDDGELVQATLEMPADLDSVIVSMYSHVLFYLYTRDHDGEPAQIYVNDVNSLRNSTFDPTRETKFVTHGWINSKNSKACSLVKDAYLKVGDYNVIVVDWSKISKRPYVWAALHVVEVAKYVSSMIDFLEDEGIDLETTTLSGHSLGAHIMGLAGYYARNRVNYVVGLDPALPLFGMAGTGSRISTEDATQVEIIHTNAGMLGYLSPIGKVDFYPNGGKKQLGCLVDLGGACSHARSYEFFAESIESAVGFYGMKCKTYSSYTEGTCEGDIIKMGGTKTELPYTGTYYLATTSNSPFAMGNF